MELIATQLTKLGLTINEAKAYIALLPLHEARASQIAAAAQIPRSKIYETMQSLHQKGFVEILPERVTRFRSVAFENAVQIYLDSWKQKMDEMLRTKEKVSEQLRAVSVKAEKSEVGEFTIVKAKKLIYKSLESVLRESAVSAELMINVSDLRRFYYAARDAAKRIELRVLVPVRKENKTLVKNWLKFATVRHYETQTPVKIAISDDSQILVFQTNKPVALQSKDTQFTALLKGFFNSAWEVSPPAKEKLQEIETGKPVEEIRQVRGRENIYSAIDGLLDKTQKDVIINTTPAGIVRMQKYFRKKLEEVKSRGVRIRCLAPVTKHNMEAARELEKLGVLIRHVDSAQNIMSCFDVSYLLLYHVRSDKVTTSSPDDYAIVTNQGSTVAMMRQMFENMWSNATAMEARLHELETGKPVEKVEILRGNDVIYDFTKDATKRVAKEICNISTEFSPERAIRFGTVVFDRDAAARGVRVRYIFPITEKNVHIIKEFMKFAEIRHVEFTPIKVRVIDLRECLIRYGGEEFAPLSEQVGIHTGASNYVSTMKSYFERIWEDAVPAEERIRELETGTPVEKTDIIKGAENVFDNVTDAMEKCGKDVLLCVTEYGINIALNKRKQLLQELLRRGIRVRYITPITGANLEIARELSGLVEVRHFSIPLRLIVTDAECLLTAKVEKGDPNELVRSTVSGLVSKMRELLENVWDMSMPAEQRIRELETGITAKESSMIIESPQEGFQRAVKIVSSAQQRAWISTSGTGLKKLLDSYPFERLKGREIKILCPVTKDNIDDVKKALTFAELRHTDETTLRATIVDDREVMVVLKKPGEKHSGSVYSNDKSLVTSVKSFFASLWDSAADAALIVERMSNGG